MGVDPPPGAGVGALRADRPAEEERRHGGRSRRVAYAAAFPRSGAEANILALNHSCRPNVGVRGQITFVAMADVPAGAELTIDYAMIDGDRSERMACTCGTRDCRRIVTGDDWRLPALQQRYAGYFSRCLQDRIDAAKSG